MPLYWFLLVVLSLGCGTFGRSDVDPLRMGIATAGLCLGWGLLGKTAALIATSQLQQRRGNRVAIVRLFERQLDGLRWAGLLAAGVALAGFGYAGWVESLPISRVSMAARAALLMVPALSIVSLLWWVDHQFGVANGFVTGGWRRTYRDALAMFRLQAAWLVLPVLLLLLLLDLATAIPGLGALGGGVVVAAMALLAVLLGLPMVVRWIWKTERLDAMGPYGELARLPALAGFRGLPAFRWDTGQRACNAMVAGFVPRCRILVLSDQLLQRLTASEQTMIVLHELAHLRRWHVPLRMAVVVPAWGLVALTNLLFPDVAWVSPVATGASVMLTLGLLRGVAHQTELDADRTACRMAVEIARRFPEVTIPKTMVEATDALQRALEAVTIDHPGARRGTWLHPSVPRRIAHLERLGIPETTRRAAVSTELPATDWIGQPL